MENGRARADTLAQVRSRHAELSRLRRELSAWREELRDLLSDGNAQGAVNWPAVAETVAAIRRLRP